MYKLRQDHLLVLAPHCSLPSLMESGVYALVACRMIIQECHGRSEQIYHLKMFLQNLEVLFSLFRLKALEPFVGNANRSKQTYAQPDPCPQAKS